MCSSFRLLVIIFSCSTSTSGRAIIVISPPSRSEASGSSARYNWSVAVTVGFVALAGVAAKPRGDLIAADRSWRRPSVAGDLSEAVMEGGAERVRPVMMTATAITAGLLPILWGGGAGASVMKRIAAPMVGGMLSSTVLTVLVIPAIYSLWRRRRCNRGGDGLTRTAGPLPEKRI
jgi:Cu(I)/Ag(I) efflux system membrane protein CusA/SilA